MISSREFRQEKPEVFRGIPVAYGETIRDQESVDPLSGNTSHSPSLEKVYDWLEEKPHDLEASTWANLERIRANKRLELLYRGLTQQSIINLRLAAPEHGLNLADTDENPPNYLYTLTPSHRQKADVLLTRTSGAALLFNPADCPIINIVYYRKDQRAQAIAQIHAGAPGIQRDIIGKTLHTLEDTGLSPASAAVYISPHAQQYSIYGKSLDTARENGLDSYLHETSDPNHYRFDMRTASIDQLTDAGVPADQIEASTTDTMSDPRYYSQRIQSTQAATSQSDNPHIPPFGRNGVLFAKK